jgi:heat shock protein HtpX
MGSTLRSVGLFVLMVVLFTVVGSIVGTMFVGDPVTGMLVFLAIAGVLNFVSYFWGHKLVLRAHGAQVVDESEAPRLHRIVGNLAHDAGMKKPTLAVVPSDTPNAFATGRNQDNAVVAATQGILQLLDDDELEGVMAHELAHVRNRDMLVMTLAATLAGAIAFAARSAMWSTLLGGGRNRNNLILVVLIAVTAPIAAMLVRSAISRNREYKADRTGADICGKPRYLARALEKLERGVQQRPMDDGNPAHSHLYIANPFTGGLVSRLFSTHPPMEDRIQRLEEMAREQGTML